ncbi:MAG: hypothetical protein LBJ41_11525 [Treponema sp.]|jgi:hypothetical protein|nr:hypothetical protein [Treponema sp.]
MAKTREPVTGYQAPKEVSEILGQVEEAKLVAAWCTIVALALALLPY